MKQTTLGALFLMTASAPVFAQSGGKDEGGGGTLTWIVAIGLAVVIMLTGFLNPKRSHLT